MRHFFAAFLALFFCSFSKANIPDPVLLLVQREIGNELLDAAYNIGRSFDANGRQVNPKVLKQYYLAQIQSRFPALVGKFRARSFSVLIKLHASEYPHLLAERLILGEARTIPANPAHSALGAHFQSECQERLAQVFGHEHLADVSHLIQFPAGSSPWYGTSFDDLIDEALGKIVARPDSLFGKKLAERFLQGLVDHNQVRFAQSVVAQRQVLLAQDEFVKSMVYGVRNTYRTFRTTFFRTLDTSLSRYLRNGAGSDLDRLARKHPIFMGRSKFLQRAKNLITALKFLI